MWSFAVQACLNLFLLRMETRTDEQLVAAYLSGDKHSFETLLLRYIPILYRFLYRFTNSIAEAEDVTQDVFVKVWKNVHTFDSAHKFKTWIFTIAKNTALDYLKKRKSITFSDIDEHDTFLEEIVDAEPLPDAVVESVLFSEKLHTAIDTLSPKLRVAFLLHYEEGFAFREIAEILGDSLDTVKSRARRAAITLREKLLEKMEEEHQNFAEHRSHT